MILEDFDGNLFDIDEAIHVTSPDPITANGNLPRRASCTVTFRGGVERKFVLHEEALSVEGETKGKSVVDIFPEEVKRAHKDLNRTWGKWKSQKLTYSKPEQPKGKK